MSAVFVFALYALCLGGCDAEIENNELFQVVNRTVAAGDTLDIDLDGNGDIVFPHPDRFCASDPGEQRCNEFFKLYPLPGRSVLYTTRWGHSIPEQFELGPITDLSSGRGNWWESAGVFLVGVDFDVAGSTQSERVGQFSSPFSAYVGFRIGEGFDGRYGWLRISGSARIRGELQPEFSAHIHEARIGTVGATVIAGNRP